jgi:hypothetical protein
MNKPNDYRAECERLRAELERWQHAHDRLEAECERLRERVAHLERLRAASIKHEEQLVVEKRDALRERNEAEARVAELERERDER